MAIVEGSDLGLGAGPEDLVLFAVGEDGSACLAFFGRRMPRERNRFIPTRLAGAAPAWGIGGMGIWPNTLAVSGVGGLPVPAGVAAFCVRKEGEGVVGVLSNCTNTLVYPNAVRSKSATEGVVCVLVGVWTRWMKDPEGARPWPIDGRRRVKEGRREEMLVPEIDGRR